MSDTLQKAQLIPIDPTKLVALTGQAITVHFNPESLKLAYTINLKADTGSKNSSKQAAQQASSSSAKLTVDLVFDTTDKFETQQDGADVRTVITSKIVSIFVAPPSPDNAKGSKPIPANPCLFVWGTFQFMGLVDSYNETLEFFSASGVPLRAAVSLSLTENRYKISNAQQRTPGQLQPLPPGNQIGPALTAAGQDAADWRGTALANGMETPRFPSGNSINVSAGALLTTTASAAGSAGFSVGQSASLGTNIAGAFPSASVTIGTSTGFGVSAGVGASLSAGVSFG